MRDAGEQVGCGPRRRGRIIDPWLPKIEEWVERSHAKIRADRAFDKLRELRLPHMRRTAADLLATAKAQRWDTAEAVKALLAEELAGRQASSINSRRKAAGFPTGKTFHACDSIRLTQATAGKGVTPLAN